ncbi:MAG: cytochrome c biogenesis protein CcdA [Gemmatimonadaceae bacterium]|nr:cytochrome c biogenesis protein CcdA [Gemmatimonadaceae bacterium]
MNGSGEVGIIMAFGAGLLSVLSPCVLPLVPSYLTFLTGLSLDDVGNARRRAIAHALCFVLGFSLIFLLLGASATAVGRLLLLERKWISRAGGALVLVFGLYLLGVLRIAAFDQERRMHLADKPMGYLGTLFVGIAFGAGWSPCIGPILGAILTYTASEADLRRGLMLLGAYSMGLAVPFVLAAVAMERFLKIFGVLRRRMGLVNKVSGTLLVIVGLLMITNAFTTMAAFLSNYTPEFIRARL